MEVIVNSAYEILNVVLQMFVILGAGFVIYLIKKLADYLGIKSDSSILDEIERTVLYIVKRENQKIVEDMKEKSPDGKLTEDQKTMIYDEVYSNVISSLTTLQKDIVAKYFPTLEEGLEYMIEYAVSNAHDSIIMEEPCIMEKTEE